MPAIAICILSIIFLSLPACSHRLYPVTTGFHARDEVPWLSTTAVIWTTNAEVEHQLAAELLRQGHIVVERARLQKVLAEQNLRISLAMESSEKLNEEIRRAGKLVGATRIIFVDVQREPSYGHEVKTATVSVRSVAVDTGQVRWSGMARVSADGLSVLKAANEGGLAIWAMWRATCMTEGGNWIWEEPSEDTSGGCLWPAARPDRLSRRDLERLADQAQRTRELSEKEEPAVPAQRRPSCKNGGWIC